MNIERIESLTYTEAAGMALEKLNIKGHDCFIVDFGGYFGYSVLVFHSGRHIYYANDYELHHHHLVKESGRNALKVFYVKEMNKKLYTDAELLEEIKTYDEYEKKNHFLRNYYIMRFDHETAFFIGTDTEREKRKQEIENKFPYFNPISFCYVADPEIITMQKRYLNNLKQAYSYLKDNNDTFREMVRKELANHEACITCDYRDALGALGLTFEELTEEKQKIVKEELREQIESYC